MSLLLQTPRARLRRLAAVLPGVPAPAPLRGRTVLVTGASSGIGEATALAAARRGATVLLVARRAEALADLAERIAGEGGRATVHPCDLTDADGVDALVTAVLAEHGAVDYLVNNAGRSIRRSLHLSHDRFHDVERSMAVNFYGPVRLTMGLLPPMRAQRFGHVVNVVSWGVTLKAPKFSAYLASKAALDTWARVAARETWADGVTFANLRFGLVDTPMIAPTGHAAGRRRTMSATDAGERVVRALEDRPVVWNTTAGWTAAAVELVAPRLVDHLMWRYGAGQQDSAAARGEGAAGDVTAW